MFEVGICRVVYFLHIFLQAFAFVGFHIEVPHSINFRSGLFVSLNVWSQHFKNFITFFQCAFIFFQFFTHIICLIYVLQMDNLPHINGYQIIRTEERIHSSQVFIALKLNCSQRVVLKVETSSHKWQLLTFQAKLLKHLFTHHHCPQFPIPLNFSTQQDCNVLTLKQMGPSLLALLKTHRTFSLKTVLLLMDQMIVCVEKLHSCGYVHREVSPGNFRIPTAPRSQHLILTNFGLAYKFHRESCRQSSERPKIGYPKFLSLHMHRNLERQQADDLESIGYIGVYLLKGRLPWDEIKAQGKRQKLKLVGEKKQSTSMEELCSGCPEEFAVYLGIVRKLNLYQVPEYAKLRSLFSDLYQESNFDNDHVYDWTHPN